ncbi:M14 family metallopeptidase [Tepidicaulis sp. LMO-SS28]|uniref:M14 family metallopeptidase n=1 Tax=Tepidicaulis sp. LMO-SS28 TaxID=3447455 RepID=UPI003EE2A08C
MINKLSMNDPGFFSNSYEEARQRFLAAAAGAGARIASYENPHARGPAGQPLFLDTAWIGPADAETVLLNTSGTHGAEGYAGSAAQLAWLERMGAASLPPGAALLMVHAVNPYGFAWGLRGTENNVDLNRNWLDHSKPHPANPLYAEVHPLMCPKRIDASFANELVAKSAKLLARHGQWALEDAITRGQYSHPDGFHFGGTAPEWSTATLRALLSREMAAAKRVGFIDWHTGPVGDGELIFLCFSRPGSADYVRAQDWWGDDALDPAHVNALWGSKRPSRRGIMFWGIEEIVKPQAGFTGAVIEFRSARAKENPIDSLRISLLERWLRFEGGFDAPEAPHYFEEILEDYAPRRQSWRENVITHALATYEQTLDGLARWSRDPDSRALAAD